MQTFNVGDGVAYTYKDYCDGRLTTEYGVVIARVSLPSYKKYTIQWTYPHEAVGRVRVPGVGSLGPDLRDASEQIWLVDGEPMKWF